MKLCRFLTLLCFAFGLLVQFSAQASAMPASGTEQGMDCGEAMQNMSGPAVGEDGSSDPTGLCDEMSLECVIAMNCIPPLLLGDVQAGVVATPAEPISYLRNLVAFHRSGFLPPQSRPPRLSST